MLVDLTAYVNTRLVATYRDGTEEEDTLTWTFPENLYYPFCFNKSTYTKEGNLLAFGVERSKDIVGVSVVFVKNPSDSLCKEVLDDVQNSPDWPHTLKQRIRESLYRKFGNLPETLITPLIYQVYEQSRW